MAPTTKPITLSTELITGDGRVVNVEEVTKIYRNTVNLASPSAGNIQPLSENQYSLTCYFNTIDCDGLENIKTSKSYSLRTNVGKSIETVACISHMNFCVESAIESSKNGRFLARLKTTSNGKQALEIWDRSRLLKTIHTSELDAHGSINTDIQFSSLQWCPYGNQDKLLYVCQRKQPKNANFFEQKRPGSEPTERGKVFNLKEDWGECLEDIEHTFVAILDISRDYALTIIDVDGHSLGNSQWMDNGNKILTVAYREEPRKLGLVHCNNRPSGIIVHDLLQSPPSEIVRLFSAQKCFHTPRVDNSGTRFLYSTNEVFGAHHHSVELHLYDIRTNQDTHLIDRTSGETRLFITSVPRNCFSTDDKHILFVKTDYLSHHMCLFDIEKSILSAIKFPTTGVAILDFQHDIILATGSEINATPTLFVAILNHASNLAELVAWHQIEEYVHLDEVEYESQLIPTQDNSSFVSALMVRPNLQLLHRSTQGCENLKLIEDHTQLPTVIIIHGGPHGAVASQWYPVLVFHARLGLKTLLVNYRGSTGVSEEYLQSLCGQIGEQDVEDCMNAIRHFVQNKSIDPNKLIVQGGSHGGFLACHLSCQNEFKFTSAIIRNPVVDIPVQSDIFDWNLSEGLGHTTYDFKWVPSKEDLLRLNEISPIFKSEKANVPTLMMLGSKDVRVPMYQGLSWFRSLKAMGVEAECKVYPDGHALSKPAVAADGAMNAAIWILSHLHSKQTQSLPQQ